VRKPAGPLGELRAIGDVGDVGDVDMGPDEVAEWRESLLDVLHRHGRQPTAALLRHLRAVAHQRGVDTRAELATPYVNTIPASDEPRYPGSLEIERRLTSIIRWNAMAMVVRANRDFPGIGGHISTYASAATLLEVAFNHFFRGPEAGEPADIVYYQGHAVPGVYARAFLEGRISDEEVERFRREASGAPGLSSYPHPWLMPGFWQMPTVSMGLSPIMAIYQARFLRYLADRGLADTSRIRVWAFIGDGECDEPETLGSISLAARERLDNLIFVVNCNLQRLDGPVRGNGKIIQELETSFRGAGWNVIKVIWGSDWDPLLAADDEGLLVDRMEAAVDGDYQMYSAADGKTIRDHFFGTSPALRAMVEHLSDEELRRLHRGGHDPRKVHAAYKAAAAHRGGPSVILAKTVKGYGLGETGEGRNVTHQQKKLNEEELREFRARFGIPIGDEETDCAELFRPAEDSPELAYLRERRRALGGPVPVRTEGAEPLPAPDDSVFAEFLEGSGERPVATTMAAVRMLGRLLDDEALGERVVPIVPDEARTFGMDSLFRRYGIYASGGQRYVPVDRSSLLYYREATDGRILEEGITEAGAMSSFIAAGTSYASLGREMVPFFFFYSMFGFQRIGDLIWAAADARTRGFLCGGTAGRTTLAGEGLQHQDGHSHLAASAVPNVIAYDPAFAYELAVIVRHGLARMFQDQEPVMFYLTLYNETYPMPPMPEGVEDGILGGIYRLEAAATAGEPRVRLLASGPIVREATRAATLLAGHCGVGADVFSVTSWSELGRDAEAAERAARLDPGGERRISRIEAALAGSEAPIVAASDYVKLVPGQIARFVRPITVLGTDGFGRSDTREALRRHFEVDAEHIAVAALSLLARQGMLEPAVARRAIEELGIDAGRPDPRTQGGNR
jgi:pyruvate dehydrogenase E1 component